MKKKSLAKNAALNMFKTLMSMIFPLVTYPYVTRILQVENIGKINFSGSVVSYFTLLAGLGISTYAIREGAGLRQDKHKFEIFSNEVFTINIISSMVSYALFVCMLIAVQDLHPYIPLILIQSIGIVGPTVGVEWLYSVYEDYEYITIRSIVVQIASMILMFVFVHKQSDYILYTGILVFASTAAYLFNFCHSKKYIRLRLTRNPNIKKHIKPIVVIFAMSVATTIYVNSDTTMLGCMAGNYYVGLYNAATKIYTVMKSLMAACILVSLPRLSNYLAIEEYAEYSEKASSILNGFLTFLPPIVIGVFMTAPQIISILAGESFLDATISLRILCISLFFSIVAVYMTNVVLLPLKKEKQIMYATFASAIINLLLNFIFIPLWKQTGAAITTVVAEIVVMLWQVCAYKKSNHCIELRLNKSNLKAIFIACCVIILICVSIDTFQMKFIVVFSVKVILSIISYIIILVVLHHTIVLKVIEFIRNCLKK
ncbi:flippase [Blautia massiliensis (ex Durand et al. 2017)]|uniref:flippase n=1 Tax=Blautia massiliensis (ex Durand et al. 2017) TaxID=1737424 RepID=UPI00241CB20E|nr:flippase [Blautia massiliensis (ex Durand et al. 2017)]